MVTATVETATKTSSASSSDQPVAGVGTEEKETTEAPKSDSEGRIVYELGFHLLPTLAGDKVGDAAGALRKTIEKNGGIFISEELPKEMQLAYTFVKKENSKNIKYDSAFFGWIKFEMLPENALALKEEVETDKSILRFIVVKTIREHLFMQQHHAQRTSARPFL